MPHHAPLIATVVAGIGLALFIAAIANRFKVPSIVGYLIAGIIVGRFMPGFAADQGLAAQLAEIGIILLMFGVGLHFSLNDLLSVRAVALVGALAQIAVATGLGMGLAYRAGWGIGAGLVFGLALSVASTVVLLRAMQERRLMKTEHGRIAVGWLIVENLAMVLTLVLLPALAGLLGSRNGNSTMSVLGLPVALGLPGLLAVTFIKVLLLVALMHVVGRRVIPWLLHYVAHTGSRELFRLAVLAVALTVAFGASRLFDVPLALGAFLAGMVMSESALSRRSAHEMLPLRDAFAVLFFVSVGMLFDPATIQNAPGLLLLTLLIIVLGKSAAAFLIARAFGHANAIALTISASLAHIGEFSFILVALGNQLGVLPAQARDLILAGALLSIMLNPLVFALADRIGSRREVPADASDSSGDGAPSGPPTADEVGSAPEAHDLTDHTVLIGYGRVGRIVGDALVARSLPLVVIEAADTAVEALRKAGVKAIQGNAARRDVLELANIARAAQLVVTIPEAFEAGQIVAQARAANPEILIIACAHSDAETEHLDSLGTDVVVTGERQIARAILEEFTVRRSAARRAKERDASPGT